MQTKNISVILCLCGILFLASCAKTGPTGPTGPAGPSFKGNINGHVSLFDQYGSPVLSGFSSVQLILSTTTTIYSGTTTIFPDATGYYIFGGVYTGSYAIAAGDTSTSNLFAGTVVNGIDFVIGTLNRDIKLSAIPDSFITSFQAMLSGASLYDSLTINVSTNPRARNCIIFVGNTASVANQPSHYLLRYIVSIAANATIATLLIPKQDLTNAGIASGKMAYYAAYSYVVNDASVYEDVASGKNVYNSVNPNPTIDSALVP